MRKRFIFLILGFALILAGCSGKNSVTDIVQKDKVQEKAMIFTKENQLIRSLETKATVTATLLNEVFPKRFSYDKGISFFVGVITDVPLDVNESITLSGKTPISVDSVEKNDFIYTVMPGVNRWGKYYIVTFPSMKDRSFTLKLEIDPYGYIALKFNRSSLRR